MSASVGDNLQKGVMNSGEILDTDPCRTCVVNKLGLMSIGVIIGKKSYFKKMRYRLWCIRTTAH